MTTTAGTTLPTAPDLLIEAADTIGNRAAERGTVIEREGNRTRHILK